MEFNGLLCAHSDRDMALVLGERVLAVSVGECERVLVITTLTSSLYMGVLLYCTTISCVIRLLLLLRTLRSL